MSVGPLAEPTPQGIMADMPRRPTLDPTEHPRPHVDVPMSIFGDLFFGNNYELVGRWLHAWCFAVWKKDPWYRPWPGEDTEVVRGGKTTTDLALHFGWLVRDRGRLRLTGPYKDPKWLLDAKKAWFTYAIEALGQQLVKVGHSLDVSRRLEELQVGSPHPLHLLGAIKGDHETRIHRELRKLGAHVSGEWFRLDDQTAEVLRAAGLTEGSGKDP